MTPSQYCYALRVIVYAVGFRADTGIEGKKSLTGIRFLGATSAEEVTSALTALKAEKGGLEKAVFVQAGMRIKKSLGAAWTSEIQALFKEVLTTL